MCLCVRVRVLCVFCMCSVCELMAMVTLDTGVGPSLAHACAINDL